ncbi:hypothetical protein V6Z11_A01G096100 [Gossypium hirsutum]
MSVIETPPIGYQRLAITVRIDSKLIVVAVKKQPIKQKLMACSVKFSSISISHNSLSPLSSSSSIRKLAKMFSISSQKEPKHKKMTENFLKNLRTEKLHYGHTEKSHTTGILFRNKMFVFSKLVYF